MLHVLRIYLHLNAINFQPFIWCIISLCEASHGDFSVAQGAAFGANIQDVSVGESLGF